MSYCRFENTYRAMAECLHTLEDDGGLKGFLNEASESEARYARNLILMCGEMAEEYSDEFMMGAE